MALSEPTEKRAVDRRIVRLALPALGGLAVEPLYVLGDTAIVGHLGAAPLGGLALATTVLTTVGWACNFLSFGSTSRVAHLTGAGDDEGAARAAVQAVGLAAVLGTVLAGVVALAGPALVSLLGGAGDVAQAATTYLGISALGFPALLVGLAGNGVLRGWSDTATPFRILVAANGLNIALEVPLVYGLDLGVAGSAAGTVVAQVLAAVAFVVVVRRRVRAAGATVAFHRLEAARLVRSGGHLFVRTGSLLAALALATSTAARMGAAPLAGHQIALQVWSLLALSTDAIAVAAQALVGTALGAGDVARARLVGRRAVRIGVGVGIVACAAVAALAPVLPVLFTGDGAVRDAARVALLGVALSQVPGAIAWALDGVLLGAGDFAYAKWVTLAALAAFVPVAAVVATSDGLGVGWLWIGLTGWLAVRAAGGALRLRGSAWTAGARVAGDP